MYLTNDITISANNNVMDTIVLNIYLIHVIKKTFVTYEGYEYFVKNLTTIQKNFGPIIANI